MPKGDKKWRVLITGPQVAKEAMAILEERTLWQATGPYPKAEQVAAAAAKEKVDGIIVRMGKIGIEALKASPSLKILVKHGVGYDNIDIEAASRMRIPVCVTPNANYHSVAEHALTMMMTLSKNLIFHDARLHGGVWDKSTGLGTELYRKCLGIIGVGRIGRRLAHLVQSFDISVIGYDPYLPSEKFPQNIRPVKTLEELLKEADYVSIHCAQTEKTDGLIGTKELQQMKPRAILINTARGGIVNEEALVKALENGVIGGAGLDCFAKEPISPENPLLKIPHRLILSPHVAGATQESVIRMGMEAVEILLGFLDEGRLDPEVLVNAAVLGSGFSQGRETGGR
jgi:D-3-phosphoglycerate dehydrogenase